MRQTVLSLIFFIFLMPLIAQNSFELTKFPKNNQLIPRDPLSNLGTYLVEGSVSRSANISLLYVKITFHKTGINTLFYFQRMLLLCVFKKFDCFKNQTGTGSCIIFAKTYCLYYYKRKKMSKIFRRFFYHFKINFSICRFRFSIQTKEKQ